MATVSRKRQPPKVGIHNYATEMTDENGCAKSLGVWWGEYLEGGFTILPNSYFRTSLGLHYASKSVLTHLLSWMVKSDPHRPLRQGEGYISHADLSEWTGMSRRTVQRAINELTERGFLTVEPTRNGRENVYRVEIVAITEAIDA